MTGARRSRSTFIVVLLFATLAMTATLAYEAQQAARSHRATAENVLRDYSTFATWELTRLGRQQLLDSMNRGLEAVRAARRSGELANALTGSPCPSGCGGSPRLLSAFRADTANLQFSTAGGELSGSVRAVLAAAVQAGLRDPDNFTCPSLAMVPAGGTFVAVVWRPVLDRANRATEIIGFVTDQGLVARAFEQVLKHNALLPPSLVQTAANPNAALAVRVLTASNQTLFASSGEWSSYEAVATLPAAYDNLKLAVALRPGAADALVIGGLPRERLPLVVGLLALTAGLVIVALVQLRREQEISRMRADFVSGVSHELRTPLAQIRMFTETLLLGRVRSDEESRRSLEIVARESQRLSQLVENTLLFSRGERQRPEILREHARLAPLIAEVVESFAPLAAARHARVETHLDQDTWASVDSGAVRQILLNLLDNAVKYGPSGQTVRVSLRHDGNSAQLTVEDDGPGISPADAERIWHPFNRLAAARTATGGAGIGLAIVKQLTDLHGGRAWVEHPPAGARFVVRIPGAWRDASAAAAAVA
jgi:signal transduction histidine kinase